MCCITYSSRSTEYILVCVMNFKCMKISSCKCINSSAIEPICATVIGASQNLNVRTTLHSLHSMLTPDIYTYLYIRTYTCITFAKLNFLSCVFHMLSDRLATCERWELSFYGNGHSMSRRFTQSLHAYSIHTFYSMHWSPAKPETSANPRAHVINLHILYFTRLRVDALRSLSLTFPIFFGFFRALSHE